MSLKERITRWFGRTDAEEAEAEGTMSEAERALVEEGLEGEQADMRAERGFGSFYDDAGRGGV